MPNRLPKCSGMCAAWHKARPSLSNSAVELSRRSLTVGLWDERISTSPASSTIESSALASTSMETGSIFRSGLSLAETCARAPITLIGSPRVSD